MKLKCILVPATVLSLAISGTVSAKDYDDKDNSYHNDSDARWENSYRQSDRFSRQGRDSSEQRHYYKESKRYKDKKHKYKKEKHHDDDRYEKHHDDYERRGDDEDRYEGNHERYQHRRYDNDNRYEGSQNPYERRRYQDPYERQRYQERYRNNPIDIIIDQNVNNAKSKVHEIQRRTIDAINNKSRELIRVEPPRERSQPSTRWWWPFP